MRLGLAVDPLRLCHWHRSTLTLLFPPWAFARQVAEFPTIITGPRLGDGHRRRGFFPSCRSSLVARGGGGDPRPVVDLASCCRCLRATSLRSSPFVSVLSSLYIALGDQPFQVDALSRLGNQSSSRTDGSSPEKNSIGGAFPCLRRLSGTLVADRESKERTPHLSHKGHLAGLR